MARYRITFGDAAGRPCAGSSAFEAQDDHEAPIRGRAFIPAQASGYEIWREDEGSSRRPLVFAEWTLTRTPETK